MIALLLSLLAHAQAPSESVRVCGTVFVDDCYPTLQLAVASVFDRPAVDGVRPALVVQVPGGDLAENVRIDRGARVRIEAVGTLRPRLLGTLTVNGAEAAIDGLDIIGDPALIVQFGAVEARDVRWAAVGLASRTRGGVVRIRDGSLELSRARLSDGGTERTGGLVAGTRSTFVGHDIAFVGGFADLRGGAIEMADGELILDRSTFEGSSAPVGAAMYLFETDTTLTDVTIDAGAGPGGASVVHVHRGSLSLSRTSVCGGAEAATYVWMLDAIARVRNSVFAGMRSEAIFARWALVDPGTEPRFEFTNNHFVDLASVGSIDAPAAFADNLALQSGAGPAAVSLGDQVSTSGNHWEHDGSRFEPDGTTPDGRALAQIAPPTERCPDVLSLTPPWTSPLRDGGTGPERDPDGSRVDVGAFGGPGAAGWGVWGDADADGWPDLYDCEPRDPNVYPGAVDRPDDGRDQDCDGEDRLVDDLVIRRCATAPGPLVGWGFVVVAMVRRRRRHAARHAMAP